MRQEFTLQQLRVFVAVAEQLHFRRAAEQLDMSQAPLTRHLRSLERVVAVELFERTTRRVALTPAGHAFLAEARQVLAAAERARRVVEKARAGQLGSFRVGYVEPLAFDLLPRVLPVFRSAFPDVDLELHEMGSSEQVQRLREEVIDVAILRLPIDQTGLEVELVGADRLVAVLWETHPLAPRDRLDLRSLAAEPFIVYAESLGVGIYTATLQACARAGFVPRVIHRATSTPMLMSLVAAREGVALVAEQFALAPRPGVRFAALEGGRFTSPVAVAWRAADDDAARRRFRAELRRAAKDLEAARDRRVPRPGADADDPDADGRGAP